MQSLALPVRRLLRKRQRAIDKLQQILGDRSIKKDCIARFRSLRAPAGEGLIRYENAVARFGPPRTMVHLHAAPRKDHPHRKKVH